MSEKAPPLGWKVIVFLLLAAMVIFGTLGWIWYEIRSGGGLRFGGS